MKNSILYRALLIVGLVIVAIVYLMPTFVTELPAFWKDYLPTRRLALGLDLQGGTHLVLSVDLDKAIENTLDRTAEDIKREAGEAKLAAPTIERKGATLLARVAGDQRQGFGDMLKEQFPNLTIANTSSEGGGVQFELNLTKADERYLRDLALDQSLETIRNRIDQFGVSEPTIQRQGSQDILVQLPGVQDAQRAKDLIGRTAVLEFKLLTDIQDDEILSGKKPVPTGQQILNGGDNDRAAGGGRVKYLVQSQTLMTGDLLSDARVRPATQLEGPTVSMEFNARGAKLFDTITAANVGKRLAIVLDDTVYSAPSIRERISGGHAQIEGNFEIKEARDLAIVLRAGALPAPVLIQEERTVGPSLGQDSIQQGVRSFIVGGIIVVVFMVLYYRTAGVFADLALVLNVFFMLALLAALQATLTLPGIAGIVLTIGMALDANVLINERMREEQRLGKSARAVVEAGYERALPAILDSNVTTFLSGVILFQFGSGPIRGFAVTLCIGIVTTVFTAVVVTRVIYDYLIHNRRLQNVSV